MPCPACGATGDPSTGCKPADPVVRVSTSGEGGREEGRGGRRGAGRGRVWQRKEGWSHVEGGRGA
eukprot:3699272-Rhodomonas_salina.1